MAYKIYIISSVATGRNVSPASGADLTVT